MFFRPTFEPFNRIQLWRNSLSRSGFFCFVFFRSLLIWSSTMGWHYRVRVPYKAVYSRLFKLLYPKRLNAYQLWTVADCSDGHRQTVSSLGFLGVFSTLPTKHIFQFCFFSWAARLWLWRSTRVTRKHFSSDVIQRPSRVHKGLLLSRSKPLY